MQRNEDGMVRDLAQNFKLGVRITQAHVNIVRGCGCCLGIALDGGFLVFRHFEPEVL